MAIARPSPLRSEPSRGSLLVGLSTPTYYNGFSPFLNWWKQGAPLQIHLAGGATLSGVDVWNAKVYLDPATGELSRPVPRDLISLSRIFFAKTNEFQRGLGCDYSGEEFAIEWEGSADVSVDLLTLGGIQKKVSPNKVTFKMGSDPGNTSITLLVTDSNSPPRNVRVYQNRYANEIKAGQIFNPDWLNVVRQFGCIRCMDWCAVNNSTIADFDKLADFNYCSWGQPFISSAAIDEYGTKGGVHPQILCELANRTGNNIHVCIPHLATDKFIEEFASYFRDHTHAEVTYELSNECWNGRFSQFGDFLARGQSLWPYDPLRGYKYYGYRAAECMNIIRGIYGNTTKWRGALATQTVNPSVTLAILNGVQFWRSKRPKRPVVSELFKSLCVTGYFGDVTTCSQPESISQSHPAIVKSPRHEYETGQLLKCFFSSGMIQLNQREVTVDKIDDDTYSIDVDTTGFNSFTGDTRNYVAPASIFKLMEDSKTRNAQDRTSFPAPHTYFSQQVSLSMINGTSPSGFTTDVSVAALRTKFWPAQLSLAHANGLILQQYEGGSHLVGDAYLTGYGGNEQYTEFLLQHGHSREIAAVYSAMYDSFREIGGQYPCKHVADGTVSQYGTWAAIRYWPTLANRGSKDTDNPVWQATMAANRSMKK
jgi:hypothetical protein